MSLDPVADSHPGIVAFHELVSVKSWADSSSRGPSIKVMLPNRDSLAIFETVTRRVGKRAGQRYKAVWQAADNSWQINMDLWFAGANWAHQDGASAKFTVGTDDFDYFRDGTFELERDDAPVYYWLTLVQVDDDERPIDQAKAAVMEKLKGGPRSKRIAMLTQQEDFQQYAYWRMKAPRGPDPQQEVDAWIKLLCGVESKVEFDHNEGAWDLFQTRVMSPFIRWGENQSRLAWDEDAAENEHP